MSTTHFTVCVAVLSGFAGHAAAKVEVKASVQE